jgi:hypothetical protein
MPLRPVDRDVLSDACRSIAQDNYGFVYVDRDEEEIKSEYQTGEKGLMNADSVSTADVKDGLEEIAAEETSPFERIRAGVYYVDPFGIGIDMGVADELQELFRNQIVITTEQLRQHFDLAHDDAEFFAEELRTNDRGLVMRIVAGNRDYYTVGPKLKDHVGDSGEDLDDKLIHRSRNGTLSHEKLEDAISVAAVSDVIDYLQTEGYVVDLDGEYLVPAALDEFTRWLADEIESEVVDAFDDSGHVVPAAEYDSLIRSEVERLSDVFSAVRSSRGDTDEREIVTGVRDRLADNIQIEVDERHGVAAKRDAVEADIESYSDEIVQDVLGGKSTMSLPNAKEAAREQVEQLQLAVTDTANSYLRDQITERVHEQIEEEF